MFADGRFAERSLAGRLLRMTIEDILLRALEKGPVTVKDILKRVEGRVRVKLHKLRVRGVVVREGRGGAHREFTYKLARPDRAQQALGDKGGLGTPAKAAPDVPFAAEAAEGARRKRRRTYLKITKYHFRRHRKQKES